MIKKRPVRVIAPVVDIPLTASDEIDAAGLKRLVEFLNTKKSVVYGCWAPVVKT